MVTAADYAWAIETHALGLNFCLTFVEGLEPDEAITLLGGADPVPIVSVETAIAASEAVQEWVDDDGEPHESNVDFAAVTRVGGWTMILEPNGFLCTDEAVVRALSSRGEMVSFYYNENTTPRFSLAAGGRELVGFDPRFPQRREGDDPARLDPVLAEAGFASYPDEGVDAQFRERTFALMERITGARWDATVVEESTFRCAAVGIGAAAHPAYAEMREELAAFAEDPGGWHDDDADGWSDLGVTDPRIKALGPAGTRLFEEDPGLAAQIAYAPADLIARMTRWAWETPFRLAGVLDEPWLAPIRDLVRRGRPVPQADVRLVEERMDSYLRDVMPAWIRDDAAQRHNVAAALVVRWDTHGPAADLCATVARAQIAGAGTWSETLVALRHAFPELADVTVPPPPEPPAERAAVRRRREAEERQDAQRERAELERDWGGRIPDDARLLDPDVQMHAVALVPHDRDLVDLIADADAPTQRKMAAWAARYCCNRAGLIDEDWVHAGVTALEHDDPPPSWFADFDAAFARWQGIPRESIVHSSTVSLADDAAPSPVDPAILAIHTVVMARHPDPLLAAVGTLRESLALDDPATVLAALRIAFALP